METYIQFTARAKVVEKKDPFIGKMSYIFKKPIRFHSFRRPVDEESTKQQQLEEPKKFDIT